MIRASLCLLAGMLVPQLSSFPRCSELFRPDGHLSLPPGLVALGLAVSALTLGLLPQSGRRCLAWFVGGMFLFCSQVTLILNSQLEARFIGDSVVAEIRVADFPRVTAAGTGFAAVTIADSRLPDRLRLTWFEAPVSVRIGDVWQLEMRLKPPRGSANPGSMDYEKWLVRERIGATGYVVNGARNRLLDSGRHARIDRLREHFVERLQALVPRQDAAAVLAAVVVGARHLLDDEQWERYAVTGTSHLMAISGLHIGLASAGAYVVLSLVFGIAGVQRNHHTFAMLLALLVAMSYAAVSGFGVPARRATLMLGLVVVALLGRRQASMGRVLAGAGILVLCLDPLSVLAPGFLLSFAAVAVLLWLARRSGAPVAGMLRQVCASLSSLVNAQFMLLAGLVPLTLLLFDRISLAAPIVNIVAVPLFSFVTVPFALLGFVLDGPLAVFGNLLLLGSAHSLALLETFLSWTASQRFAGRPVPGPEGIAWLCLLLPALWVVLPAGWPGRLVAWVGCLGLLVWRPTPPPPGCVEFSVLDVGQGLAVVGRTARHVFVYDTGPKYRSGGTAAERSMLPYLEYAGIRRIDRLVISHSDLDHAGGVEKLVREMRVRHIASGDPLSLPGRAVDRCRAGDAWHWDGVAFSYLHPQEEPVLARNDASCVLLIEAGARRALLAGDIEAAVEARLVQARVLPEVDVTTVPHHGSRTSSTVPYVRALQARHALVSAAWRNQWGMPKPDIVERWRILGAEVLNTADSGAIEVRLCAADAHAEVKAWRQEQRRLWHAKP